MKRTSCYLILFAMLAACSSDDQGKTTSNSQPTTFTEGQFGYDLEFLQKHDDAVVLSSGNSKIIVSPKYQAKVFTSTADGESGMSFGWVNYKAFDKSDAHMNAYGGENRIWLGPEGGKFSLFFKPGNKMEFANWKTPSAVDTESWKVTIKDSTSISLTKAMSLVNYAGTQLDLVVNREIRILTPAQITGNLRISADTSVKMVGYQTSNTLINQGKLAWTEATGMPCIWILDMFKPSPETIIVVPFRKEGAPFDKVATTNYFGEISADRLKHNDGMLFFKADGKSRGKLGIKPDMAVDRLGSYDFQDHVLTIVSFDLDDKAKYLNQEWNTSKPSFSGDAVNAYNDGPLADGSQMGPFYEMESVSPAAFLEPNKSLMHKQSVFHFTGNEKTLNDIALKTLGISLEDIRKTFQQ